MPRYRKLHTKTIESLDLNDMPDDFTRLFWVLLPLALCREGRGLDNGAWLKSRLFPLREDITQDTVYQAFRWCCGRGMIERYAVDGRGYFHVPTFHKYQGNTTKEAESDYPPPPEPVQTDSESDPAEVQTYSRASPEQVQSKSGTDADAIYNMQYTDADATTPSVAVAALASFGMSQAETVLAETDLSPSEVLDTLTYAQEHELGAGWVRTQLRDNQAHRPRAPDADDYWRQFVEHSICSDHIVGATPRGRPERTDP